MSNKNEIKLINACIRKNNEIKKLKNDIETLKSENVYLIEVFQILQKVLDFELTVDTNDSKFIISKFFDEININDYEKLNIALERYGINNEYD